MILSLYLLAPLLALWLALPLLMRPAFVAAGLAPTPAATTTLALGLCAAMLWYAGPGKDHALPERAVALGDSHLLVVHWPQVFLLVFAALGLAGAAMMAAGLVQTARPTLGTRLRQMVAGFGAYCVHVGAGLLVLLAFGQIFPQPARHADQAMAMAGQETAGQGAATLFLAGAALVLLSLALNLILRINRR